jgi:hypothetical protein
MSGHDTKERHFCFVYRGEALRPALFESLHFQNAEGAYCREDGLWYVRVSLDRTHGRRAVNIPNIIDEYNEKVADKDRIQPTAIPQMQSIISCFKTTGQSATNHIVRRLQADSKTNPTYWKWEHKPARPKPRPPLTPKAASFKSQPKKAAPQHAPIRTGLEGLVRDLNLDPNTLDMQGAYTNVSRNYMLTYNTQLSNSGQFDASDRDFLLNELSRYFSKELAFVTTPFGGKKTRNDKAGSGTVAALVAANGGTADDFKFICSDQTTRPQEEREEEEERPPSTEPNETISVYFREMLPRWLQRPHVENVEIAARDIVIALNGGSGGGTYRSTCIPSFLRPFINDNLIKSADTALSTRPARYIVDVKGMAAKLNIVP